MTSPEAAPRCDYRCSMSLDHEGPHTVQREAEAAQPATPVGAPHGVWTPSAPNVTPEQTEAAFAVIASLNQLPAKVRTFTVDGVDWYYTAIRKGSILLGEAAAYLAAASEPAGGGEG